MKLSTISIRGMHKVKNKTYDLKGFRYFHGENGVGKSTIMQAIQLALLGYIPGTDKNKSAIFKHSNGLEMLIQLTIDDNGNIITIKRHWCKKGKDIIYDYEIIPTTYDIKEIIGNLELPIFDFSEFIKMSSNKLKDWFINFLPTSNEKLNWDMILSDAVEDFSKILDTEFYEETLNYVREKSLTINGIQLVRDFNTYLKEQQSFYKAELTRLQSTVQNLIYYSDCDNSQSIEELMLENKTIQVKIDSLNSNLIKIQHDERILMELESIKDIVTAPSIQGDKKYISSVKVIAEGEKQLAEYEKKLNSLRIEKSDIQAEYTEKKKFIEGKGNCPYTNTKCTRITNMANTFKNDMIKLEVRINELNMQIDNVTSIMSKIKKRISDVTLEVKDISEAYIKYETLSKQIYNEVSILDKDIILIEIDQLKANIEKHRDTIIKLEANKKYEELINNLTNTKYKVEQNIEILKVWIKLTDVNGLQSQLMEAPFKKLAVKMSEYLQKFFDDTNKFTTAKFHIAEKANSFSFGVTTQENEYIEFDLLSSGEKCLYTLALLLSIVEYSNSPLKIVMIDDLLDHLDMLRIKECFETLYSISDVQILLAGVQDCTHSNAKEFVVEITS